MRYSLICLSILTFIASAAPPYGGSASGAPAAASVAVKRGHVAQAEPKAEPAAQAVFTAFRDYPVVALGMSHRLQDELDFAMSIVRDPEFPKVVNAIVLECGNSLYQNDMDRYVSGEDVPLQRLQRFWRNTTQLAACEPTHPKALADLIRGINAHQPANRQIRILAGDPPINWDQVHSAADIRPFQDRDGHFASVVEHEVLAKHLRALLIVGSGHVLKRPVTWAPPTPPGSPTVTILVEQAYPHSVFVIQPHDGFGDETATLEPRLAQWSVPSLAIVRDTWLGRLDAAVLFRGKLRRVGSDPNKPEDPFPGIAVQDLVDAYLYLGPAASLRETDFALKTDPAYAAEIHRRIGLMSGYAGPVPLAAPLPRG